MSISSVLVVGAGLMGGGIAQVCAQAGIRVLLHDANPSALEKALKNSPDNVHGLFLQGYYGEVNEFARSILENRPPKKGTLAQAWQVTRLFEAFADHHLKPFGRARFHPLFNNRIDLPFGFKIDSEEVTPLHLIVIARKNG